MGLLDVKGGFKRIQIILVIIISLAIPMSSAYVCCYTAAAADFLSPNLNFENFDQELLLSAYESKLKVFIPGSFFDGFHQLTYLFGQSSHFFFQIPSPDQGTLTLRC
jgi:hypothetical protein